MKWLLRKWPWVLGLVLILIVVGVVWARSGDGKELDSALTTTVKRGDFIVEVVDTGKIQPREKADLKSKVAGEVIQVLVNEGDTVKKDQPLLRLDPIDYQRAVTRAEADVAQAKIGLEYSKMNMERRTRGLADRGVAQSDVDVANNEFQSRTVALQTARVDLASAKDRLRYTTIVSPINGTVIARGIEPGEVVTPGVQATFEGKPLMTVANLSVLLVKVNLNQIDVSQVQLGQTVEITLDALPGKKYQATVTKVAPASVKGTKDVETFPVEATLTGADGAVKPGMTADVRIQIARRSNVLSIPIEAVLKEKGKTYVTQVKTVSGKKTSEKKEVVLGARNERDWTVESGVAEGDVILISPGSAEANDVKI